jgi:high-affinity Fe2+/Pb2+ permease
MDALRQRVWQLGIGILLALTGTVLMYLGGADGADNDQLLWAGLILFFVAMLTPLVSQWFERQS